MTSHPIGCLTAWGQRDSHAVTLSAGEPNRSPRAGTPYQRVTWQDILTIAQAPGEVAKDRAQFFIASSYAECDGRTHEVQRDRGFFHALCVDIDKGSPDLEHVRRASLAALGNAEHLIYSSSGAGPQEFKWRVLVPLAAPILGADYTDTQKALFAELAEQGIKCDTTLDRPGQPVFLPNVPPNKRAPDGKPNFYRNHHHQAPRLDLRAGHKILTRRAQIRRDRAAEEKAAAERATAFQAQRLERVKATGDDFDPMQHFKDNHSVAQMLSRYGFEHKGRDQWTSPLSESGSPSTKDYGEYWVCASAWAHNHDIGHVTKSGARKGDAFDLYAYFEHGNSLSAAMRAYAEEVRPDPPPTPRGPNGQFTSAALKSLTGDAPQRSTPLPLREARIATAQGVQEALDIAAAWNPEGDEPAPVIALRYDPGLGKSRSTRDLLARTENMVRINGDVHFYAPSLALADEGADHAATIGLTNAVTRGRLARNPATGKTMCDRPAEVERVGKLGQPIKPTMCIAKDEMGMERKCPFYDGCAHRLQFLNLPEGNAVRFEALPYLTLPDAAQDRAVGLRIIDETFYKAMGREATIKADDMLAPRSVGKCRGEAEKAERTAIVADLVACAGQIVAALRQGQPIMQALEGYTADDLRDFARAENWAAHRLPFFPDAPIDAMESSLKAAEAHNSQAGARAQFWTNLWKAKEDCVEDLQNVVFVAGYKPQKKSEPRDVVKVFWHVTPPRDAPAILLDADADSTLIEPFYPSHELKKVQVQLNADVTYITDRTFSNKTLLKKPARDEWRGVISMERDRDAGGGVLVVATRKVVAAFFADAGIDLSQISNEDASAFMRDTKLHGVHWAWFGPMTLGSNQWKDCTTCIVIGREEWPVEALENEARKIWSHGMELIEPDAKGNKLLPAVELPFPMADGSTYAVEAWAHPDPRVRAIQLQNRECSSRQSVERLRLASAVTPKRVVIGSRIPIPGLPANHALSWAEYKPSREETALAEAEGALRLSPKGMSADARSTFATDKAAGRHLEKCDVAERLFNPPTLNVSNINGKGVKNRVLVAFRIKGVRGSKKTRAILTCEPSQAEHLANMKWGDLIGFEVLRVLHTDRAASSPEEQDDHDTRMERIAIIQESEGVPYFAAVKMIDAIVQPPLKPEPFRIATHPPPLARAGT